jgi:integrase
MSDVDPVDSYCSRLGHSSAATVRSGLRLCLEMLDMDRDSLSSGISYGQSLRLVRMLEERYSSRTVAKMISFWRGLIGECWRLGLMSRDEADRAMPSWRSPEEARRAGRHLGEGEIRALASACGEGMTGSRNEVLLCLLGMGLRRCEVVGLRVGDWDGSILRVRGKRGRVRDLKLPSESAEALTLWIARRRCNADDPLVCAVRGGEASCSPMSPSGIRVVLRTMSARAGVSGLTPHDFRRTFAGNVLSTGADVGIAMRLMGHASPSTTLSYDRRPAEVAWEVGSRIPSPLISSNKE